MFVTPGPYATYDPEGPTRPVVGMHTYPVPFSLWADKYEIGQHLVTARTRQVSHLNWPPELKCRSRMHYYLADREASREDPLARAVLLDLEGYVSEASTANVLAFFPVRGLVSPPQNMILPGISQATLQELAASLAISFQHERLQPDGLAAADEVLLSSTSPCVLPVVRFDGKPVGDGKPGSVFQRLLAAWDDLVGVDIATQARKFARRK
jgi:branched-subunit amino acid aminotransferase/4-amino-4-deoxychorismate lyase